jgi:dephospho-CoA kinase
MIRVGLTGNIGSGKSLVSGIFNVLGIPVYHSDSESKRFLDQPEVRKDIMDRFGRDIFFPSGEINRKALATLVFSDPRSLKILNDIMHPLVIGDFRQWSGSFTGIPYVINEAAIIFEQGIQNEFDRMIHVSCPPEIAIERVMERDRTDEEPIRRRMLFQWEDRRKSALADFVVINDNTRMLIPQVLDIHQDLLQITF